VLVNCVTVHNFPENPLYDHCRIFLKVPEVVRMPLEAAGSPILQFVGRREVVDQMPTSVCVLQHFETALFPLSLVL
jgi:hypothetical protein